MSYESLMATASQSSTGLIVMSMFVIVAGFVVVGGLFYAMVYKPSKDEREAARLEAKRDRRNDDE